MGTRWIYWGYTFSLIWALKSGNNVNALENAVAPTAPAISAHDYSKLALSDWTRAADEVIKTLDADRDGGGIDAMNKFKVALDPKKNSTMEPQDLKVALETLKIGDARLYARLMARVEGNNP